jgi:hypothetical protein
MFRAPALPPLLLGLVVHFVLSRSQKARGAVVLARPVYVLVGFGLLAVGMLLVGKISPEFALDRIGESVAEQQRAWTRLADPGGSAFEVDQPVVQSLGGQLLRVPISLLNALLRPQFFDVTSPVVLASAIEMTAITWFIISAFRRHGVVGALLTIQRSPFLVMCTLVTVVGCMFVGLTTRNFGSLARYRVPFLPFYGALLACLTQRTVAPASTSPPVPKPSRRPVRRRPGRAVVPT